MKAKRIASELFRSRPETPFIGYLPPMIVLVLFGLYALHEGVLETVPYLVLLAICAVQLRFRTLAGWLLLLGAFCWYAIEVGLHPENSAGRHGEYVFFVACGVIPAAFLFFSFPRLKKAPPRAQDSNAAGAKQR